MRKFEFKKSYEEIEIGGEIYKVSLKDDDRKKYNNQLLKFYELVNQINNVEKIDLKKSIELEEKAKEITLETLDALFGEGSADKLYEACEQQIQELMPLIYEVAEIIQERRKEKFSKYTKKKVK